MARMSVASDGSGSALVEANDGYAVSAPVVPTTAPRNRRASCPDMLSTAPSMPQMGHAGQAACGQGAQQSPSLFLAMGQHPEICQLSGSVAAAAQGIAFDMATAGVTSNFSFEQFVTQYAKIEQAVQAMTQHSPELAKTDQNASIALLLLMIQAMQTPKPPQMVPAPMQMAPAAARPTVIATMPMPMQTAPLLVPVAWPCTPVLNVPVATAESEGAGILATSPRKQQAVPNTEADASARQEVMPSPVDAEVSEEAEVVTPATSSGPAVTESTLEPTSETTETTLEKPKLWSAGSTALAQDGNGNFLLEPYCGGFWDWPLSRPEKKHRAQTLYEMELLFEVEDLRAIVEEYEGSECEEEDKDDSASD